MDRFTRMLHWLIVRLSAVGSLFLAIVMLIIYADIVVRIFGKVVNTTRHWPPAVLPPAAASIF